MGVLLCFVCRRLVYALDTLSVPLYPYDHYYVRLEYHVLKIPD